MCQIKLCFCLECQWKCLSLTYFLEKLHLKKWTSVIMLFVRLSGTCRQLPHAGNARLCWTILIKFVQRWGSHLFTQVTSWHPLAWWKSWPYCSGGSTENLTGVSVLVCFGHERLKVWLSLWTCFVSVWYCYFPPPFFFQNTVWAIRKRSEAAVPWNIKATFFVSILTVFSCCSGKDE